MFQKVILKELTQHTSGDEVLPKLRSLSLPHCNLSQDDRGVKMSSKSSTKNVKPQQMLIKETLGRTKKLLYKTFKNLKKSLVFAKHQEQHPTNHPTSSDVKRENNINSKSQEVDDSFYGSYSEKWDANAIEVKKIKEVQVSSKLQTKKDDKINTRSISFADCRGLEGSKEDKNARKHCGKKPKASSFRGADALARKMKGLEMMEVHDMDQVLDVEEVLHYYSRLNCPSYVEIVDNFFTDMYSEFHDTQLSMNGSMRRLSRASAHSSMRKLGRASAHSSMRNLGPLKL